MAIQYDLKNLNLFAGVPYEITVKARAEGFADSEASNSVEYRREENREFISGKWYFDRLYLINTAFKKDTIQFTSNSTLYESIEVVVDGETGQLKYDDVVVATWTIGSDTTTWTNDSYKAIKFVGETQQIREDFFYDIFNESIAVKEELTGAWYLGGAGGELPSDIVQERMYLDVDYAIPLVDANATRDKFTLTPYTNPDTSESGFRVYYGNEGTDIIYDSARDPQWLDGNNGYRLIDVTSRFDDVENASDSTKRGQDFLDALEAFGVKTISFTINGTTYYAQDGMSWEEWLVSDFVNEPFHNDDGVAIDGDNRVTIARGIRIFVNFYEVYGDDIILEVDYHTKGSAN